MSNRRRISPQPKPTGKVILGYLHPGMVHGAFMRSLLNMLVYDASHDRRLFDGGGIVEYQAGANLATPRNQLVEQFRAIGTAEWLLMVDSDMTFPANALDRLLDRADPDEAPIFGGLCFGLDGEGHAPTLYDIFPGDDGQPMVGRYREWEIDSLMKVAGTGTAFLLIHRTVFERFDAFEPQPGTTAFNKAFPYFQETEYFGKPIGEDLTFCFRAGFLGIPVHVDTSLHIGHIKDRELNFASYIAEYAQAEVTP